MPDGKLVGGLDDFIDINRKLWRVGMWVAAREPPADVDSIDEHAGGHDQLANLPQGLPKGCRDHRLGTHMEGNAEAPRNLARPQQQRRRFGA